MTRLTVRGLFARKLRAALTALAVLLGVAMISGTYIFTDTINSSFDRIFENANEGIDVVVSGREAFELEGSDPPEIAQSLVDEVRKVDGVALAAGSVEDDASVIDDDGDRISVGGAPALMFSRPPERFDPLDYVEGRPPATASEVAIDQGTADKGNFEVGERLRLAGRAPSRRYEVTGIAKFGDVSSLGGATVAVLTLPEAQRVAGQRGLVDSIEVGAGDGVTPAALAQRLRAELPRSLVDVKTGTQSATDEADSIQGGISFLSTALLAFAGIALFVGAFIIFNTFSITVAQRTTEIALLRTIGASRGQVMRSVVLEALLIGVVASLVGLLVGFAAAEGISAMFRAFGIDLPRQGTVFKMRTVIVAMAVGVIVTMVAGLAPARRATRVSPLAAMREESGGSGRRRRRRTLVACLLLIGGAVAVCVGLFGGVEEAGPELTLLAMGSIVVFIAVALLSPILVPPIAAAIGWPLERLRGVAGRLARENAMRNPGRTAVTAAALMIGLALVTFVTILGAGLRESVTDTIDESFGGDLVLINKDGFSSIPAGSARAIAGVQGVAAVSSMKFGEARVRGDSGNAYVTGIDPRTFGLVWKPEVKKGPPDVLSTLGPADAVLKESWAEDRGFALGDRLRITSSSGSVIDSTVRGTVDSQGDFFGDLVLANAVLRRDFDQRDDTNQLVAVVPGQTVDRVQARVDRVLKRDFPTVESQDRAEFKDGISAQVNQFLALLYALLSLSIIVSLFGIVNTLVLSIHERTREIGMMRAIGTSRRLVRRMVRYESVITALIGAALGLALGVILGALTTEALADEGLPLTIPVPTLIVFAILAALAGVLAAILPARRASRLNVLEALAYE